MSFRFEHGETVTDAVRRVAGEELDAACVGLVDPGATDTELRLTVHDVRKRAKKVRGLIRLVRPGLGREYRKANTTIRDAARLLSPLRDAHALLTTFDAVVAVHPDHVAAVGGVTEVRAGLRARSVAASRETRADDTGVAQALDLLARARSRVDRWDVGAGFGAMAPGLEDTYERGRRALRAVGRDATDETRHEWRKRAKYLWYQVRLLAPAAPSVLGPLSDGLHRLGDGLGDDHDLAVLTTVLRSAPEEFGGPERVQAVLGLVDEVRGELLTGARGLGRRLYAEPADAFTRRVGRYWTTWEADGDEPPSGGIAALGSADDDLATLTRDELYGHARHHDVPGRSQMTRDDLLAAIRAAGGPPTA